MPTLKSYDISARLKGIAVLLIFMVAQSRIAFAAQIEFEDFGTDAIVQDFEGLGSDSINYVAPLVIGEDTFNANDNFLSSSSKLGLFIGRPGTALGNSFEPGNTGFIDVELAHPAIRAGMYVGFQIAGSGALEFYDNNDSLVGTVSLIANAGDSSFGAWQANDGRIHRIRVTGVNHRLIIDDFIQEVPEPASVVIGLVGTSAFFLILRRRRQCL